MELPHRFITPNWIAGLTTALGGWALLAHGAYRKWGPVSILYSTAILMAGAGYILLENMLRLVHLKRRTEMDYEQVQAVVGLYSTLQPRLPLFQLRRFALCPDTANLYMYYITKHRPSVVVELGSGASTVISGLTLKKNRKGKVIALDDSEYWVKKTDAMLKLQGVDKVAEARYAPQVPIEFQGLARRFYDLSILEDIDRIDMLLVDGPHDGDDSLSRLPGLHLLADKLSNDAIIFADDTVRPNWNAAVKQWAEKNGFSAWEPFPNESGLIVMKRKKPA